MPKKPPLDQAQFRVGDAMVHPERLVISINDEEHSIEPRIMEVLIALASAAQNSETLSAVNLYIRAWIGGAHAEGNAPDPRIDMMQAENPVHKAITHLRKVFGDDPKSPRYIETIRKRGYRLVAPVVYQDHYRRVAVARKNWTTGSPYVGLNAFDSRHASVFLGRSRTTGELIEAVRRQIDQQRRLVLVVGASGCGKTSLVNAGAIPILTEKGGYDGLRALSVARCDLAGTRREDALPRLAAALMQWTLDRREILPPQPVETLAGTLRGQPESLPDTLEDAFRRHASRDMSALSHPHLLLVIDHAEAIVADPSFGSDDHAEIDRFLHHLCESRHVCVIVIVRGDFYLALAEALPGMTERKSGDGHVDVLAPRTGEIGDIIRIPAASAGLEFQQHPESKDYLDDVLLRAAVAQPDALPLLQHTLQMLYERRNGRNQLCFDAYHEIGGLEGALSHHAEHVFTGLPDEIQASLDQVLSRMVVMQPENDRVSARRIPRSMLDAPAIALAEAFVQARLFVAEHENGDAHYRVAHEALLRQWPRAVDWIRENRRMLMARIRLQRAAARWVEDGRRDDHLITSRDELREAESAAKASGDDISHNEAAFIARSNHTQNTRKRIRNASIAMLGSLTVATSVLWMTARQASQEAIEHRRNSQRISANVLGELADAIRPTNKLELLDLIATEALESISPQKIEDLNENELLNRAKSLRIVAEVKIKQGKIAVARQALIAAARSAKAAASSESKKVQGMNEYGQIAYYLGYCDYLSGDLDGAERHWRDYLENSNLLIATDPLNPEWIIEKSYAIDNIGTIEKERGKNESATRLFSKSATLKSEAIQLAPDRSDWIKDLTDTRSKIASINESTGNLVESAMQNAQDQAALRIAVAHDPGNMNLLRWLGNSLARSASLAMAMGDKESASIKIAESISILNRVTESTSMDASARRDLAYALMISGDIARSQEFMEIASKQYHNAGSILNSLLESEDTVLEWKRLHALIRMRIFRDNPNESQAESVFRAAVENLESLEAMTPQEHSSRMAVIEARIATSSFLIAKGNRKNAETMIERTIAELKSSANERNTRIASAWVALHVLRGTPDEASSQSDWLKLIGYDQSTAWAMAGNRNHPHKRNPAKGGMPTR